MLKLNGRPVSIGSFPDGTLLMKEDFPRDYSGGSSTVIHWHYENDRELVALIFLTRHCQSHGADRIHLVMPYIPNARQDRVKSDEDVFTLKYFAEIINGLHFASVTVLDPHSTVSEALFDRLVIRTPKKAVERVIADVTAREGRAPVMFYPDEGASKRYSGLFALPFAFGNKKRDWKTGAILGLDLAGDVSLIPGSTVLIVDDICSRGGTFYHSALRLKESGAERIYLYVSHCEQSILSGQLPGAGCVEQVYTTDSIFAAESDFIRVIPCDEIM